MSQKKIQENREAVAEKMKTLLFDNKPIQAQDLLDTLNNWLWSYEEMERHQRILDESLNEE